MKKNIVLRDILSCNKAQQQAVLQLRNLKSVRDAMFTDHVIGLDEHAAWLDSLSKTLSQRVFVVLDHDIPAGVASVSKISQLHRSCEWAFYLDDGNRVGLGPAVELAILDYMFNELGMYKVNCEVLESNPAVLSLHRRFGFAVEGLRASQILKNGQRVGIHLLGMTSANWQKQEASNNRAMNALKQLYALSFDVNTPTVATNIAQSTKTQATIAINTATGVTE